MKFKFNLRKNLLCLPAPVLFYALSSMPHKGVAALLIFVVESWTVSAMSKWLASLVLLLGFSLYGNTALERVFAFPLSMNFVMIVLACLFSQGVMNAGIFDNLIPILKKKITSSISFVIAIFISSMVMIWLVPQPFARIVIQVGLFGRLLKSLGLEERPSQIVNLYIVHSAIVMNAAFINGDIILNMAVQDLSGLTMTTASWIRWFLVPTIFYYLASTGLSFLVFQKESKQLSQCLQGVRQDNADSALQSSADMRAWSAVLLTVLFWSLEDLTGIRAAYVAAMGTFVLAVMGYLRWKDLKCINLELMIFLTASFSIGPVMKNCGAAGYVFSALLPWLPQEVGFLYLFSLMAVALILHMILGSCVTTLSVVVPSITTLLPGDWQAPAVFTVFIVIISQYLLPLHNNSVVVGEGVGGFKGGDVFKWGAAITPLMFLSVPCFYWAYWKLIALI